MPATFSRNLARNLRKMLDDPKKGPKFVKRHLSEALEKGQLKANEVSIRALAEETVEDGHEWVSNMDPRQQGGVDFLESSAVSSTHFSNITGQIFYSRIMEAATAEDFVFSKLIEPTPTSFDGEKIPGITNIGDQAQIVAEGDGYPNVGVSEDYVETPRTTKRGLIVSVTKEAVFFDRTGQLLAQCSKVGTALGYSKEKRLIDAVIDENVTDHRYRWRGSQIATYNDNTGTHTWDNLAGSNPFVDSSSIAAAELLMSAILDPNTNEPMPLYADTIICTPQIEPLVWKALNAFLVAMQAGGFATSGNLLSTQSPNPIGQTQFSAKYRVVSSRQLAARMATDTYWYLGRPTAAIAYMENWPITVMQSKENSEAEFTHDVVARYKASERGAAATIEPRYMIKNA